MEDIFDKLQAIYDYISSRVEGTYTYDSLNHRPLLLDTKDFYNYQGTKWISNKALLLELLYLGCAMEHVLVSPFNAKTSSTFLGVDRLKPTLSSKDPAFPAWWVEHKAEWEA